MNLGGVAVLTTAFANLYWGHRGFEGVLVVTNLLHWGFEKLMSALVR